MQYFGKVPKGKKEGPYNITGVPEEYVTLDLNNPRDFVGLLERG